LFIGLLLAFVCIIAISDLAASYREAHPIRSSMRVIPGREGITVIRSSPGVSSVIRIKWRGILPMMRLAYSVWRFRREVKNG
jgi:hypothetical protein